MEVNQYAREEGKSARSRPVGHFLHLPGRGKVHESTDSEDRRDAERPLKEREGRLARGEPILPRATLVLFEEGLADLRRFYEAKGPDGRDLYEVDYRSAHLAAFLRGRRLAAIGPADATAYTALDERRAPPARRSARN